MEDDSPVEALSMPNTPRNLAAWKITIPYVDFFEDPSLEKRERRERIPVFCIDVERNDRLARKHYRMYAQCLPMFFTFIFSLTLILSQITFPKSLSPEKGKNENI